MKHKKKYSIYLLTAAISLPVFYLVWQMLLVVHRPYTTQTAMQDTLQDAVELTGIAVRDEYAISRSITGVLAYTVENGARVPQGGQVAVEYQSAAQANTMAALAQLDDEIAALKSAQDESALSGTDLDALLSQLRGAIYQFIAALDNRQYGSLQTVKNSLALYSNRMQIATGQTENFNALLAQLQAERDALSSSAGSAVETFHVNGPGYFLIGGDALTGAFSAADVDAMNPSALQAYLEQPVGDAPATLVGGVQTSYSWQFYAVFEQSMQGNFAVGDKVTLTFEDAGANTLPATVTKVEYDKESGQGKVVFNCDITNSATLALRVEQVQVTFHSYTGLRVDKKAMHIVDGEKGVYIRFGDTVQFKKIAPIYEDDTCILLPLTTSDTNEVALYDEVIIEGKDLYDGKLLS